MLVSNFDRAYSSNKAPFVLSLNADFLQLNGKHWGMQALERYESYENVLIKWRKIQIPERSDGQQRRLCRDDETAGWLDEESYAFVQSRWGKMARSFQGSFKNFSPKPYDVQFRSVSITTILRWPVRPRTSACIALLVWTVQSINSSLARLALTFTLG